MTDHPLTRTIRYHGAVTIPAETDPATMQAITEELQRVLVLVAERTVKRVLTQQARLSAANEVETPVELI